MGKALFKLLELVCTEFLKTGILEFKIPDIILKESGHLRPILLFPDLYQEIVMVWQQMINN